MAKFKSNVFLDKLTNNYHGKKNATSNPGFGLGGNDVPSRPGTIDEQAPIQTETMRKMPMITNETNPKKSNVMLSEEDLLHMLEEA